jgi:hypothetical protein
MTTTGYRVIKIAEDLRAAVQSLSSHVVIGLDTETTDLDPYLEICKNPCAEQNLGVILALNFSGRLLNLA